MATDHELLAGYAQDRYESSRAMLTEYRNCARQLAVKIAAAIGIEITVVVFLLTVLVRLPSMSLLTRVLVVAFAGCFVIVLGRLLSVYRSAVKLGYAVVPFLTPREPDGLRILWSAKPRTPDDLYDLIAIEYSRARRQRLVEGRRVGKEVAVVSARFTKTLVFGLFATLIFVVLIAIMAVPRPDGPGGTSGPTTDRHKNRRCCSDLICCLRAYTSPQEGCDGNAGLARSSFR